VEQNRLVTSSPRIPRRLHCAKVSFTLRVLQPALHYELEQVFEDRHLAETEAAVLAAKSSATFVFGVG